MRLLWHFVSSNIRYNKIELAISYCSSVLFTLLYWYFNSDSLEKESAGNGELFVSVAFYATLYAFFTQKKKTSVKYLLSLPLSKSHASIIRRVWDHMDDKNELLQYGIRSGLKEEFEFMREHNTVATSLKECLERLEKIDPARPVYLTLDLDFFDPAFLPGTGTPEAGGEDFHAFMRILKILNKKNFVGADVVELAPHIDPTGNSNAFASKVTREILLALQK